MRCFLAWTVAVGCSASSEVTGPRDPSLASRVMSDVPGELRLSPVEPGILPLAVVVRTGDQLWRVGPLQQWRTTLPVAIEAGPLWIDPLPEDGPPAFYPLWIAAPSGSHHLPLVPRVRLPATEYRELIDLLQEFIAPYEGSRIRRWRHHPVTVSLPETDDAVDYASACRGAIDAWNAALGGTWLTVAEADTAADVRCEVRTFERLAVTQLLETDDEGRPTAMRIQLSPRWAPGSERYVRRTYLHEFGHVLGLWGHSIHLEHVMNGRAVIRDELHPDELRALRWLWAMPEDFDLVHLRRPRVERAPDRVVVTRCEAAMERGIAATRPR